MRCHLAIFSLVFVGLFALLGLPRHSFAQEIVRAKIGLQLQVNEKRVRAKSRDQIRAGDRLRVYLIPEQDVQVYMVYSDATTASLLKQLAIDGLTALTLPPLPDTYQVDDASSQAFLTIICSLHELPEVVALFSAPPVSHKSWKALEDRLVKQSKLDLSQVQPKSFAIAGNVRAQNGLRLTNPGHQTHVEGDRVSVPVTVDDPPPSPLVFKGEQLPPGLEIDATSGLISGTIASGAAARSPYHVKITVAHDTANAQAMFAWSIEPEPFFKQLQISSGKSFLVKTYAFRVKK